jgi:hypothetical protein
MAIDLQPFTIEFPEGYDERFEFETPLKGWLAGVVVRLEDGSRYKLCFYDPVRLQQTVDDGAQMGRAYFTEPGLVIVPEVSTEGIREAVSGLVRENFFQHLKSLP